MKALDPPSPRLRRTGPPSPRLRRADPASPTLRRTGPPSPRLRQAWLRLRQGFGGLGPQAILRRLQWLSLLIAGLATGLALLWGFGEALGVAAGGALAIMNYGTLVWTVDRVLTRPGRSSSLLSVVGFSVRYALLALVLYVILARWKLNALAIIAGFSAPVVALFVEWGIEIALTWSRERSPAETLTEED